jgi:hypothetical protein
MLNRQQLYFSFDFSPSLHHALSPFIMPAHTTTPHQYVHFSSSILRITRILLASPTLTIVCILFIYLFLHLSILPILVFSQRTLGSKDIVFLQ